MVENLKDLIAVDAKKRLNKLGDKFKIVYNRTNNKK